MFSLWKSFCGGSAPMPVVGRGCGPPGHVVHSDSVVGLSLI